MDNNKLLALLSATAAGDKKAFADLYQLTSGQLFAVSLNMMGSHALAEEALQEAYVKIWHNASEYQASKGAVLSWMVSIVRYRCLDSLRYNKVRKEQALEGDDVVEPEQPIAIEYAGDAELVRCIGQLDEKQRQVIHLAYYKGLSHQELVQHVVAPLGTVKSWVRRALVELKRCLTL